MNAKRNSLSLAMVTFCLALLISVSSSQEPQTGPSLDLRLVPIHRGLRESSFGSNPQRFKQTEVFKAAQSMGVDILSAKHPLVEFLHKDSRLFYLFYNVVDVESETRQYLVQRIAKTVRDYTGGEGTEPSTEVTFLVEAIKTRAGTSKKPDEHFGRYSLGNFHKREIVKQVETGFADIEGIATGREWPFESHRLFKKIQPYDRSRDVYDKVRFIASTKWTLSVSLDRHGNYSLQVPELAIDISRSLPSLADVEADDLLEPATRDFILMEGRGVLSLVVGESRADDVRRVLGPPLQIKRASARAQDYTYKKTITFNIYDDGEINTISTEPSFAGHTSNGIRHGDTRRRVLSAYGNPIGRKVSTTLTYRGVIFWFDAADRVEKIVLWKGPAKPSG